MIIKLDKELTFKKRNLIELDFTSNIKEETENYWNEFIIEKITVMEK